MGGRSQAARSTAPRTPTGTIREPTIGSHQAHGCRPPCRLAASDQLSRSTGRALRSLCRSPTACRQVSASAREPSGPTDWSARSKPRAGRLSLQRCHLPVPPSLPGVAWAQFPRFGGVGSEEAPTKGSPPSAAQTVRAVFRHTAFTRVPVAERWKVSARSGEQDHTRRRACARGIDTRVLPVPHGSTSVARAASLPGQPEAARRRPLAQPLHIDAAPHLRIELHSIHPSCVPQNTLGMLGGPLERSGFLPPSGASNRRAVVYSCSAVLSVSRNRAQTLARRWVTGSPPTLGCGSTAGGGMK